MMIELKKISCALGLAAALSLSMVATADVTDPLVALRQLNKVGVETKVSHDIGVQLFKIGAAAPLLGEKLSRAAHKKLEAAGLLGSGSLTNGYPKLVTHVDIDIDTDELTVTLQLLDLVSPVRDPGTKFVTCIWSQKGHPRSDSEGPLVEVLNDLLDHFIADWTEANAKRN